MFGMDARIALIVAAILAAAGGMTMMSRLERGQTEQAEVMLESLRQGVLKHYTTVGINQLAPSVEDLFRSGVLDNPSLQNDPWGKPWSYEIISSNVMLEGTPITVHFAIIASAGKDGVFSSPGLASDFDYAQWETRGDDVGIKLSTRDIEMARKEEFDARGSLIIDKLEAVESAAYVEAQNACEGDAPPSWCEDEESKNYTQFNYYPKSSMDTAEGVIYYATDILGKAPLTSGDPTDMAEFLSQLGLPPAYAQDPWGRVLMYQSNATARTDPPFSASICFSRFGEDCFAPAY